MSTPAVGRIVHFHEASLSDQPMAAIINYVRDRAIVDLTVMISKGSGSALATNVPYSHDPQSGSWSWPPLV